MTDFSYFDSERGARSGNVRGDQLRLTEGHRDESFIVRIATENNYFIVCNFVDEAMLIGNPA
jgi:hypothetical protein